MRAVPRRKKTDTLVRQRPSAAAGGPAPDVGRTVPWDPRAAERARRAEALARLQEQRRERAGRRRPGRPAWPRSAPLVLVLVIGLLIASAAVTGFLVASARDGKTTPLAAPLHVYPVLRVVSGACPAGTQGITGMTASGQACYQLTSGIAIREVVDIRVREGRPADTYEVAIELAGADRRAFAELTKVTAGRTVAFVVRDQLITAPRVDMPITDGKVVVSGRFTRADAERLVRTLRGS